MKQAAKGLRFGPVLRPKRAGKPAMNDSVQHGDQGAAGFGPAGGGTIDPAEVARFAAMAEQWWDPKGKFRPLHELNPTRVKYIRDRALSHFGRPVNETELKPLAG